MGLIIYQWSFACDGYWCINIPFQCCDSPSPHPPFYNGRLDNVMIGDGDYHDGIIIAGCVFLLILSINFACWHKYILIFYLRDNVSFRFWIHNLSATCISIFLLIFLLSDKHHFSGLMLENRTSCESE